MATAVVSGPFEVVMVTPDPSQDPLQPLSPSSFPLPLYIFYKKNYTESDYKTTDTHI